MRKISLINDEEEETLYFPKGGIVTFMAVSDIFLDTILKNKVMNFSVSFVMQQ